VQQSNPLTHPAVAAEAPPVILRMATVRRMTTLGRSTIYRLMSQKLFPSAIKLGPRAVGWRLTDIDQWLEERPDTAH
jgi:prophage regulatory protein